jgi:hypothetical protein
MGSLMRSILTGLEAARCRMVARRRWGLGTRVLGGGEGRRLNTDVAVDGTGGLQRKRRRCRSVQSGWRRDPTHPGQQLRPIPRRRDELVMCVWSHPETFASSRASVLRPSSPKLAPGLAALS